MNYSREREAVRAILGGSKCHYPASVYDPLSARIAELVGYQIGIIAGSVSATTILGAPDLCVLTLTEFAEQIRRIMRVSKLSLLADADHGYGNALNVMRTVQELEHAGVSVVSIQDSVLPARFGQPGGSEELISAEEMVGKLRAAVQARHDSSLVIAGRTAAIKVEGTSGAVARVKAYAATGVDALFITWVDSLDQLRAIRDAVDLPLIVGPAPSVIGFAYGGKGFHESTDDQPVKTRAPFDREALGELGVRIVLQGHQPVLAAAKALQDTYTHLYNNGAPADLKSRIIQPEELGRIVNRDAYKKWQSDYLKS